MIVVIWSCCYGIFHISGLALKASKPRNRTFDYVTVWFETTTAAMLLLLLLLLRE